MKLKRKQAFVIVSAVCIAVLAAVVLYRPQRAIIIEVEGPPTGKFEAVFVVDGERKTETVPLPRQFTFYARDLSYRINPVDKESNNRLTGRIYTDDGFADGSSSGWSVGGRVSCSNVLGIWRGGILVTNYTKDSPGPEVTIP